jgi:primosomal protein N' (replication factor Y)
MIAKVLVDVPVKAVDRLFDYEIPSDFESVLEIGSRVIVPFGNRDLMGFCLDITTQKDTLNPLKPIRSVLDIEPYVTNELIELAKTVSMDTTTVLIRVLETMIPSALKAVYKPKLKVIDSSR